MRRTLLFRVLACTVAAATAVTAIPTAAAAGGTPGNQPLPGYTIVNPPLTPATVDGRPTTVRQGTHRHAAYVIEVPAKWNGDLVMWAHGYRGQGTVLTVDPPAYGLRQKLLDRGYAWAASSYSGNGFDIRAGVVSTKELTEHFGTVVRRPHRTYIAGVSMGGYVIGRSLEEYPRLYDGGLPMCGVMGDQRLIDYFLDYQLTSEALSGITTYPAGADYLTAVVPAVQQKLGIATITPVAPEPANPLGQQFRDITVNQSGGPRPGAAAAFAYWKNFLFSLSAPAASSETPAQDPGLISTNLFTRYKPNTPVDVNRSVRRVAPEEPYQRLSRRLTQVPKIEGRPRVPVLSLHGLGDLFVPFGNELQYKADVDRNGRGRLVVQRAIRSTEHCEFSPTEVGTAWDDLVTWVRHDRKPAGDRLDPKSVAAPDYGCRFSDRAAYTTGTRRLYAACA
ncbi:hypothetical protein SAMN05421812_101271 [Asanoa hainanensis]|uniref:Uncharacterized protein n=1 Tax=Asanoa hainanensis TaxID=560556 RepID=A0A239G8A2_9ACTN|nr:hypothetical protein [Asanoa hainanensis]SNS65311.1 hypothetical protein SAMN05421812_101271 [Asanoa hainanensis]